MSETPTTPESTPVAQVQVTTPAAETFSLDYVQGLRNEAAKYRTEKKDAVEVAKAEVIREYEQKAAERDTALTELQSTLSGRDLELLKLKSILAAEIPSEDVLDVATLVQGIDEESVSESVNRVKALLGKSPSKAPAVDPSQGSGSHMALNGDPLLEMVKRAVGA